MNALREVRVRQAKEKLVAGPAYRDSGFVFADAIGNALKLDGPTKAFVEAARKLGIAGVTLHSCRHFVGTWAISLGSDVRSVATLLGHSVPSTTLNVYGHVVVGAQERAVAAVGTALDDAKARLRKAANGPA